MAGFSLSITSSMVFLLPKSIHCCLEHRPYDVTKQDSVLVDEVAFLESLVTERKGEILFY
jgi:hypothetical protein